MRASLSVCAHRRGYSRIITPSVDEANFAGESAVVRFVKGDDFLAKASLAQHLHLREWNRRGAGGSRGHALQLALADLDEARRLLDNQPQLRTKWARWRSLLIQHIPPMT